MEEIIELAEVSCEEVFNEEMSEYLDSIEIAYPVEVDETDDLPF